MSLALVAQRGVDGLANGSLYGALALALTLVHRTTGRVNLAQGELATMGTYASLVLATPATGASAATTTVSGWVPFAPWPAWAAIAAAMVVSAAVAAALERFVVRSWCWACRPRCRNGRGPVSTVVAPAGIVPGLTRRVRRVVRLVEPGQDVPAPRAAPLEGTPPGAPGAPGESELIDPWGVDEARPRRRPVS